jgi:polygalacturonase
MKHGIPRFLALSATAALLAGFYPGPAVFADDDPYWNQRKYDEIEKAVTANAPEISDASDSYGLKTTDGAFSYWVRITDSKFSGLVRDVTEEYYAANGETLNQAIRQNQTVADYTKVFEAAMLDVKSHGGGTVVVPAGSYVTGAIHFAGDNTRLHLDLGAELKFIRTKTYEYYPRTKTRFEGMDLMGFSPLIYAYRLKNIAITGSGNGGPNADADPSAPRSTLNGQADRYNWLPWKTSGTAFWDGEAARTIPMQQGGSEAYKTTELDGVPMTARDKLIEQAARWTPIEDRL